jgi:acetyl esterase/lipase
MNYRFSQHALFPAQICDCKAAVRWVRKNAHAYGLDPDHIGAWGSSAGGHLVALLGTTSGIKDWDGNGPDSEISSQVQAVVDWFGPTDFLTIGTKETRTRLLGGDPLSIREKAIQAGPITYVSSNAAPFLIMHGDKDTTVPLSQSQTFAEALRHAGADVTFLVVKGAGHGGAMFHEHVYMQCVQDFFTRHLIHNGRTP